MSENVGLLARVGSSPYGTEKWRKRRDRCYVRPSRHTRPGTNTMPPRPRAAPPACRERKKGGRTCQRRDAGPHAANLHGAADQAFTVYRPRCSQARRKRPVTTSETRHQTSAGHTPFWPGSIAARNRHLNAQRRAGTRRAHHHEPGSAHSTIKLCYERRGTTT